MTVKTTYYIEYDNGKSAWLSPDKSPSDFPNVTYTEERPVLFVEIDYTLKYVPTEEIVGQSIWLKDTLSTDYIEIKEEMSEPPVPNQDDISK